MVKVVVRLEQRHSGCSLASCFNADPPELKWLKVVAVCWTLDQNKPVPCR